MKDVVAEPEVEVQPVPGGFASEPSPVSDASGPAFETLARSIGQAFATSPPLVVPFLTRPTDGRYWAAAGAKNVYRFTPFLREKDWMARAHGTDERIAVSARADGVRFYAQLIRNGDALRRSLASHARERSRTRCPARCLDSSSWPTVRSSPVDTPAGSGARDVLERSPVIACANLTRLSPACQHRPDEEVHPRWIAANSPGIGF